MKKSFFLICLLTVLSAFLWGCSRRDAPQNAGPVVTRIAVTCQNGPVQTQRSYTSPVKMRAILNYLRWIDPYGVPQEDPEQVDGTLFRIVMIFSDGSEKVYLQKADRYMQIDGAPWKTVDPQKALTLSQILGQMKSDEM